MGAGSVSAQRVQYSSAHRNSERALPQTMTGGTKTLQAKVAAARGGISLVVADFDQDGVRDLVTGYGLADGTGAVVLQRGAGVALAPTAKEQALLAAGQFVSPYVAKAETMAVPVKPDLLESVDLSGYGHQDLLVAAKGGSVVYLLAGRGDGTFLVAKALSFAGPVTALTTWRGPEGTNLLVGSVCASGGCGLQVMNAEGKTLGFAGMPGSVSSMEIAPVNGGSVQDVVAVSGGKAVVVDGESLLGGAAQVQTVMSGAVAVEAGYFTYNLHGGMQLAVLGNDATLHLFTRGALNVHQMSPDELRAARAAAHTHHAAVKTTGVAWTEVETAANFGPGTGAPVMMHGHISGNGYDDLVLMAGGQYYQWTHQATTVGDVVKTEAFVLVDSTSDTVTAAKMTRIAANSQLGIVSLGGAHPMATQLPAYRTITVTGTGDSATVSLGTCTGTTLTCSVSTLRSAVYVVNTDQGNSGATTIGTNKADTINLAAGTYTLTAYNGGSSTDVNGDVNIHLDMDGAASVIGAGSGSTFIQTTNTTAANEDNIFDINSGVVNTNSPSFDTYFSALTVRNGTNNNNHYSNGSSINYEGGLIDWAGGGSDSLTLVNVVLSNGTDEWVSGGALEGITLNGHQVVELDNSTISGSRAPQTGGGIDTGSDVQLILSGMTISGNTANPSFNSNFASYVQAPYGSGGGVATFQDTGAVADVYTGSIFTGNAANGEGGGLYETSGLTMSGSTFSGNSAGVYGGGAINISPYNASSSITTSSFTGNYLTAASDGNALCVQNGNGTSFPFTLHYSRLYGNKPTGSLTEYATHTGLAVGCNKGMSAQSANATDNWWGCNGAATGTNCDTAGITSGATDTSVPVLSPFTTLTLMLSSTTPSAGDSFSATGSLAQDSSGTVYSAANDAGYIGVPASVSIVQNGGNSSITTSGTTLGTIGNPTTLAGIQGTATATQAGTGLASITVDGCVIRNPSSSTSSTTVYACGSATASNFTVSAADLAVSSAHTGNFKAGDTADTYTLTVANIGNASTSGTVTVTDTLPSGFTATALSGTGWTCTLSSVTCTRSDSLSASVTYPGITLTVSVSNSDAGTYTNTATVSGGGEINTNNDTGTDSTIVVGAPTIAEAFSPTSVAPGVNSAVTFTLGNPSANSVSLTGVVFTDTLPGGLKVSTPNGASTTCTSGTVTATAGGSSIALSGATVAAGANCTVTVNVVASAIGSYTNTTGTVTATNSNAGGTASATLTVAVTPTKLVYTSSPATPISAGGNSGTFTVALEDNNGNINTSDNSTQILVKVTASGYLQTYSATVQNGVGTFGLGSITLTSAQTYTYTATSGSLTQAVATEVVNPGAAASFAVTGLPTFTAPQMSGTATVKVLDSYGNVVTGFTGTVTLSSTTDPTATFSPVSYTYTASDAGSHAFTVTFDAAGTQTITATSGAVTGAQTGIVVEDAIWILNRSDSAVRLTDAGAQTTAVGSTSGNSQAAGIAFDNAGNVWATQFDNSGFVKYSAAGATLVSTNSIGGLDGPASIYIDGGGQAWFANASGGSLSVIASAGTAVSPSTGYQPGTFTQPVALIVDSSGSVWVADFGGNQVVRLIGAAAPVTTPIVTGTVNKTLGAKP